jgi:O-antigen/teichoic acid export membrane protein
MRGDNLKKKSLGVNALLNSIQSILNLIFPLITFPYISRVLSVDGVGKYNFSNSFVSYFILLAGLGISTFAVREGAKYRDDREKISEFASRVFTINIASTFVSYVILFVTLLIVPSLEKYKMAILIFSIQIFFTTLGTDWVYIIFEEYGYITARNIAFKILSIVLLFAFVRNSGDYLKYATITVFASTGSYILNFLHAKKFCDIKIVWKFNWKPYLIPIFIIFGSTVSIQLYVSVDTILLGFLKSDYVVGIYGTSVKIYTLVVTLLAAMLNVTVPRIAFLIGQKRSQEFRKLFKKLVNTILAIAIPGVVGLFMIAKNIIILLASTKYLEAVSSLKILSFAILGSILNGLVQNCALIPAKREKNVLFSTTITAIVNILLNLVLIPKFSENAAAFTTVVAELLMFVMNCYFAKDIIDFIFKDKQLMKNIVVSLISCFGIVISCILCQQLINSVLLQLLVSVVASAFLYGASMLLFRNTFALDVISQIKLRLRN